MVVGSSNSTYDQYQSFEDQTVENTQTKENNAEVDNNEVDNNEANDSGYTDVYPDIDASENTELSNVEVENTLNNLENTENKVNYIDLDVTNNNVNNIEIKDNKIMRFCKKNFGKHYKLIVFLIMIELAIFGFIVYRYMSRPRLPVNMPPEMIVNNLRRFN